jgi:carbonic anhydrase
MQTYEKLLLENKAWAKERVEDDQDYFKRLSDLQTPEFLWIGCSDSRVPANEITNTQPGEIFVHRNIANLVIHTDVNLLSVLDYAVVHLKVKHVIVCGHYGCGGVKAAMSNTNYSQVLNMWLRNIKDRLTELSVIEQVQRLAKTSIIQKAWKERDAPDLHGWVYGLKDGLINPVFEMKANTDIDPLYEYHNL